MPSYDLTIPFTLIACDGCGQRRAAAAPCPHCESRTISDDPEVERRRRIVGHARPLLDVPTRRPARIKPHEVFGELGGWSGPFLEGCKRVMDGSEVDALARIAPSVGMLRMIGDRVAVARRAPNEVAIWATIDGILASFRRVVEEYFAALTTADPVACQEYGAAAQRSLDAAAQIAGALGVSLKARADAQSGLMNGLILGALSGWLFHRRGH